MSSPIHLFVFSIEDPFETHYDVAHVIKSAQMIHIRKEFLVSFNFCSSFYSSVFSCIM
jgi:hypothetical protein